jgi:hypothetical protein
MKVLFLKINFYNSKVCVYLLFYNTKTIKMKKKSTSKKITSYHFELIDKLEEKSAKNIHNAFALSCMRSILLYKQSQQNREEYLSKIKEEIRKNKIVKKKLDSKPKSQQKSKIVKL